MKKFVLTLALTLLVGAGTFASSSNQSMENNKPIKFTFKTVCGVVVTSYSYEPVAATDVLQWQYDMTLYYCEQL